VCRLSSSRIEKRRVNTPGNAVIVRLGAWIGQVLLPVESGVLFPECQSSVVVAEESGLDAVRYVQGEQIPLFGFCTYTNPGDEGSVRLEDSDDDDATLQAIGTMALLRDVEFSEEEGAEGARCTCVGVQESSYNPCSLPEYWG